MRFLILGAGALGGYYGGLLQKGGADVTFLVRSRTAHRLSSEGLKIKLEDEFYRSSVQITSAEQLSETFDVIILTCKAFDIDEAIDAITPAVGPQTAILPILNGVNHIDMLIERFNIKNILGGVTQFLVNQDKEGTIIPTYHGAGGQKTVFGEVQGGISNRCIEILEKMKIYMPDASISEDIMSELWMKVSGAGPSFAVAALLQKRAGKVAETDMGSAVVSRVYQESSAVCEAEGYPPPTDMRSILVENLWGKIGSDYGPSILSDIESGRRTEGKHVIGDLVKRGRKHNLSLPLLEAALCKIELYENALLAAE